MPSEAAMMMDVVYERDLIFRAERQQVGRRIGAVVVLQRKT
jgi:hypothetical protein